MTGPQRVSAATQPTSTSSTSQSKAMTTGGWVAPVATATIPNGWVEDRMSDRPLIFIAKHGCDDKPYVHDVWDRDDPCFTFDGPDYTGWYRRVGRLRGWWLRRKWRIE